MMTTNTLREKIYQQNQRLKRSQPLIQSFLRGRSFRTVNWCDFCSSRDITIISQQDRYGAPIRAAQCGRCGLIFLVDRLSLEDYSQFYNSIYRSLLSAYLGRPISEETIKKDEVVYARNLIKVLGKENLKALQANGRTIKVLDIGGSVGNVSLVFMKELSAKVTVLDPCEEELKLAANAGLETIHGLLENWIPSHYDLEQFDLLLCCRTIDHFLNLRENLEKLRHLIASHGRLLIDIVDFDQIWATRGTIESAIKIDHCYYLSSENASAILKNMGLEPFLSEVASHSERVTYICRPATPNEIPKDLSLWAHSRLRRIQDRNRVVKEAANQPYTLKQKLFGLKKRLVNLFSSSRS